MTTYLAEELNKYVNMKKDVTHKEQMQISTFKTNHF